MKNIMIDIETLGTRPNSVILSIAAVEFDIDEIGESIHLHLDIQGQLDAGRVIDDSTLTWWIKNPMLQKQFSAKRTEYIPAAATLLHWLNQRVAGSDKLIWAKGPQFDLVMIKGMFHDLRYSVPWRHWNERCVNTIQMMIERIPDDREDKHDALSDAIHQAKVVSAALKQLGGNKWHRR